METNILDLVKSNSENYKKYFFPCDPLTSWRKYIINKNFGDVNDDYDDEFCKAKREVDDVTRQLYTAMPCEIGNKPGFDFAKDTVVDIEKLLFPEKGVLIRINGVEEVTAKDLRGKYIMVCCFFIPELWYRSTWDIALACHEFYVQMSQTFEVVIVAKMRSGWTNDEAAFNHFLSGFHSSSLVVPFKEESRRHFICESITATKFPRLLLVAPSGEVLAHYGSCYSYCLLVPFYGGSTSPFPFITRSCDADTQIEKAPSSLRDCLCYDYVWRIRNGKIEYVGISHLQFKTVMLYLYTEGNLLRLLCEVEKVHKSNESEFEIVVLYLPSRHVKSPWSFSEAFANVLAERNLLWWVAPINYTAYGILTRFFDFDKLVIVGPNDQFVDPRGAEVLKIYGIDAYPFTFEHVVNYTFQQLKQVTLKSLVPSFRKTGKVVLLYFDYPSCIDCDVFDAFYQFSMKSSIVVLPFSLETREEIKSHVLQRKGKPQTTDFSDKLKWFHYDNNAAENFFLKFFNREFPTIVAFGKDGRLRSVLAQSHLPSSQASKASGHKYSLKKEVSFLLADYYSLDALEYLMRDSLELSLVIKAKKSAGFALRICGKKKVASKSQKKRGPKHL